MLPETHKMTQHTEKARFCHNLTLQEIIFTRDTKPQTPPFYACRREGAKNAGIMPFFGHRYPNVLQRPHASTLPCDI